MSEKAIEMLLSNQVQQGKQIESLGDSVKEMAKAVNKLAVIDEKMANDRRTIDRHESRLDEHAKRLWDLEQTKAEHKWFFNIWDSVASKVATTVITGAIMAGLAYWGLS